MNQKVEFVVLEMNKMIFLYLKRYKTDKMPSKVFYDMVEEKLGFQKSQAWYYLKLSNYTNKRSGFGQPSFIVHKETKLQKTEPEEAGPPPF